MQPFSSFLVTLARRASYVALTGALAMVVQLSFEDTAQAQHITYETAFNCDSDAIAAQKNTQGAFKTLSSTGAYNVYCHPVRLQAHANTTWLELYAFYWKSGTYVPTAGVCGKGFIGTTWGAWTSNSTFNCSYTNGNGILSLASPPGLTAPDVQYYFLVNLPADINANSGSAPHTWLYGYKLNVRK